MSWNYSEAVDRIGQGPMANRIALIYEQQAFTFAELRSRVRGIGAWLQSHGLKSTAMLVTISEIPTPILKPLWAAV